MESTTTTRRRESCHYGDLRAQLIEATRLLVEESGPDHFSVSEACRCAGVSTAAPYKHFRDKDEMLRAVALAGIHRQREQMLAEIKGVPPGTLGRIVALGRVYVRFAVTKQGVFRLMFGFSGAHVENEALARLARTPSLWCSARSRGIVAARQPRTRTVTLPSCSGVSCTDCRS